MEKYFLFATKALRREGFFWGLWFIVCCWGLTALSNSLLRRRFLVNSKWQRQAQKQVQRQGQLFSLRSNVSLLRRRFLFCGMTARRHERFVLALRASEIVIWNAVRLD